MVHLTSLIHLFYGVWTQAFFRRWTFYIIHQRGTHLCRLFYWGVRYTVTRITQIRDKLGK